MIYRMIFGGLVCLIFFAGFVENLDFKTCQQPEHVHSRRVGLATCIAACLQLNTISTNCSFNVTTGRAIEKYNNLQEDGCPKCYLALQNYQSFKIAIRFLEKRSIFICGKKISFGTAPLLGDYDSVSMICGMIEPNNNHWMPKNYDEVRCMIEGLPENIQKLGKLRVLVYKSACSKEFFFCSTDTPRSLRKSFLGAELNGNQTVFQDGTCAIFEYKMKQKKAVDLRLKITDCKEKAYLFCEHND
ncbi:Hypothetical predicted protein [Cloeon dipterum]|uniref:C-type lectin domain-containing protein n=1 Tax=Cloeon dipterum TaxID=197152 RepID=A0A8S1DKA9_9INSE|nr:Hypothetical predicted protein [Cloeon dipterum]